MRYVHRETYIDRTFLTPHSNFKFQLVIDYMIVFNPKIAGREEIICILLKRSFPTKVLQKLLRIETHIKNNGFNNFFIIVSSAHLATTVKPRPIELQNLGV